MCFAPLGLSRRCSGPGLQGLTSLAINFRPCRGSALARYPEGDGAISGREEFLPVLGLILRSLTMTCEHLRAVEQALLGQGFRETFRGQAWSSACREWVYFDCFLDLPAIRDRHALDACVIDHAHRGTHDGEERGLVCQTCQDAIMGSYAVRPSGPTFRG